ncbi:Pentatricopeptide repeat [Dillenia turbinata]|uniref:Pentatricopeptide repeat n=1 Tax=Dillenia turbinata TaxID=194707 RepID=A0AAN8VY74_9MAGN
MHSLKHNFLTLISRCTKLRSFKQIHAQLVVSQAIQNDLILTKVAEFFGKHIDLLDYACTCLISVKCASTFPYNTLISGYATSRAPKVAFLVYRRVVQGGFLPDTYTFPVVLKSCAKFVGVGESKQVHGLIVKMGFCYHMYVQNSLVHAYGVCGECYSACRVFDEMLVRDVVSWTGLISGYVSSGLFRDALVLFKRMDVEPNAATYVSVLVACGRLGNLNMGKGVHGSIVMRGFDVGLVVGNALIDMYVKSDLLSEAKRAFDELPDKDIVSWTSIISGMVQSRCAKEALEMFRVMQIEGLESDRVVLTSVLSACGSLGALDYGKWVHEYIKYWGIEWDVHIGTALVDMYAKCGCIEMALKIFHEMSIKNVLTWNALLGGLAMHGHGKEALKHFEIMIKAGVKPSEVTFLAILTACCHSGLVNEGQHYFNMMISQNCNLSPMLEHYGCMVDLLCRAGLLDEAQELIERMPMPPDVLIWGALLGACKASGNAKLSQKILDRLLELESRDSGAFVLLSNIYAINDRWHDVTRIRRLMKNQGVTKVPGSSVIEVDGKGHEFLVGDFSHPENEEIHRLLNLLTNGLYVSLDVPN